MATSAKKAKAAERGATESPHAAVQIEMLRLSDLFPSPTNPRKTFPETELRELAESIKANGLINPITVRAVPAVPGQYEVVSGGRRYRASIMSGLLEIPCIIRELTDAQVMDIQIEENLHRQDVPPLEEAAAFHDLLESKRLTVDELAGRLNKSAGYVYRRLKLNQLHELYRPHVERGELPATSAEIIAAYPTETQQAIYKKTFFEQASGIPLFSDANHLRNRLRSEACTDLNRAIWPLWRNDLQPGLQACNTCESNTAVATLLFPDGAAEPRCTNKSCWKIKEAVWKALVLKEWEAYCESKGIKAAYADLDYYQIDEKKTVEKIVGYEPEVISRYNYQVVEEGTPGAFEAMMVGSSWSKSEMSYSRRWIKLTERDNSGRGSGDWEIDRINEMEVPEEEKARLIQELYERRETEKELARQRQFEQAWKLKIIDKVFRGNVVGTDFLHNVIMVFVRDSFSGHRARATWLDYFAAEAKDWKPVSFAMRVNGDGEDGKKNPAWTEGAEKAWQQVLERKKRKGDYETMDIRAWNDMISAKERTEFLDSAILGYDIDKILSIFTELTLARIREGVSNYGSDPYAMAFFTALAQSAGVDPEALKDTVTVDESDEADYYEEEGDEYDDMDDFDNEEEEG